MRRSHAEIDAELTVAQARLEAAIVALNMDDALSQQRIINFLLDQKIRLAEYLANPTGFHPRPRLA